MTEQDLVIALSGRLSAFGDMDSDAAFEIAPALLSVVYEFASQQAARELDFMAKAMWDPQDSAIIRDRAYRLRGEHSHTWIPAFGAEMCVVCREKRMEPCEHCKSDGVGHRVECPRFPSPAEDVGCRRCKGHGWNGPKDRRPGVTCDDCSGTGETP